MAYVPRSAKFIIAAIMVFGMSLLSFPVLLAFGIEIPIIAAPVVFGVVFVLAMAGLISVLWD